MPNYDYHCPANGKTVEVAHAMGELIETWGELCERGGIPVGKVAADSPVEKAVSLVAARSGAPARPQGPCGSTCGCFPN
ncbi:MAG: zinc ribbon domain-containing protein [Phycisphaerales bacterium]